MTNNIVSPARKTGAQALSVNQRNHLRLLLRKTENVLSLAAYHRQKEWMPYFYLSELLQRSAFRHFDKELKKHYKSLHQKGFFLHCLLLKDLELERLLMESVFNKQSVQKIEKVLNETDRLHREYADGLEWRAESYKVFLKNFDQKMVLKPVKQLSRPANVWQRVYALRHAVHGAAGIDEKIALLRQLYRLTYKQNSRLLQRETATTCSNLATYYMIQGKFNLSFDYFNRALRLKKYFRPANYFLLQFNYVGLSLRNLRFDTAYHIMRNADENIQRLPAIAFKWNLLKCMCYVFAGQEKEIRNILPAVPEKKNKDDYIYFYAVWAIYFTTTGKSETAVQMIETGKGLVRRHKGDPALLAFLELIKKYHLNASRYSPSTAAVKTLLLFKNTDLKSLSAGNILPLIWLKKYLETAAS